jgi:hypothetical protein
MLGPVTSHRCTPRPRASSFGTTLERGEAFHDGMPAIVIPADPSRRRRDARESWRWATASAAAAVPARQPARARRSGLGVGGAHQVAQEVELAFAVAIFGVQNPLGEPVERVHRNARRWPRSACAASRPARASRERLTSMYQPKTRVYRS